MAKRVNVRFLTILTVVVVAIALLLGASPYIYYHLLRHNPKHWITLGEADVAKGNWQGAVNDYGQALQLDGTNKQVCVSLGDAWYHLTSQDVQNVSKARAAWNRALEIDPQYVPALQRLLSMEEQFIEVAPMQQALYGEARDVARRLAAADPTNADAKAEVDIATVQQWLASGPVSDHDLQQSLAALKKRLQRDPSNADLVFQLGRAYIAQGVNALKQGQGSDVADDFDRQARAVVDSALAVRPNDPDLNLRAFQVFEELSVAAHLTEVRAQAATSAAEAIANAYANVKPHDALYAQIVELTAHFDLAHGKKAEAEAALSAYHQQFPDDLRMRVVYADALAQNLNKRDEAIALLSEPIADTMEPGPKGQAHRRYQMLILSHLTGFQIDQCAVMTDAAQREKQLAKIAPQLERLENDLPDDPKTLQMKGAYQSMKGQRYEAIDTLSRAKQLLEANSNRDPATYFSVLYQLGTAYMNMGQDVSAEKTLEQAAQIGPLYIPLRRNLAALYQRDRNAEQMRQQIDAIAKADPNEPSLPGLRLAYAQLDSNAGQVQQYYGELPEDTHANLVVKAQAAASMGNLKECSRLLKSALQKKQDDPQVSLALASAELNLGDKAGAVATLQAQHALSPNNDQISLALDQLENASPDKISAIANRIDQNTSPFSKSIKKFGEDYNSHKYDAAMQDLKAAELAGGNEALVAELYFQLFLVRQQYDDAAGVVSTLTRLNADDANGLTFQIRLAMAQNHRDEAIHYAQQLTGSRPELAVSWVMLGDAYRANGQFDHALENYRQALDRQAMNVDALTGEIDCYIALQKLDSAEATISKARHLFPDNQGLRAEELNYKMTYGDPEEVVAELEKNIAAAPDDANNYQMLVQACMLAADSRSAGAGANGPRPLLDKAHDALATALSKWPDDVRFVPMMAQVEQRLGDFDGALKLLTDFAALPRWKDRAEPQLFLADLYDRAGRSQETEAALRAAWAVNKNDVNVQLKLAHFLGGVGKFDDALAVLTETSDPAVARERLELLVDAGRYAEAETGLQDALAKSPSNVDLLYILSVLHASTGHFQDAQADITQGLNTDPKNVALLLQSARIEMARPHGDLDLASRQLMTLLQVAPKNLDATAMLSDLYVRKGQLDAGIAEMESALKLAPLNKPLRVRLARMYMSTDPPEWAQFDDLLHKAEQNDQLSSDPTWFSLEAAGLFQRNQNSDGLAKMRQAQAMAPDNMGLEHDYIDLMLKAGQYGDALQEIDRVLATGKRLYWLREMRGLALAGQGQKQQAGQEFQAALTLVDADGQRDLAAQIISVIGDQIDPDTALKVLQPRIGIDAGWRLLAVSLYEKKKDYTSALKIAGEVAADPLASSAQRLDATRAIAESSQQQGDFDKAKTAYLSWIQQQPDDVLALNNLACLLNDNLNQPHEALVYSKQAYDLASKAATKVRPFITDTQGWVQVRCGGEDARNGRIMLEQLIQDHPEFVDGRYHLAEAYIQAGMYDSAISQLSSALDLIKAQEANHAAVSAEMRKNIDQALDQAKQAAAKAEANVR